jgi:cobalamin biosynthetic protein CobC
LPGSQAAIQWLPRLLPPCRVAVLTPGYGEYAPAWRAAGHEVRELALEALAASDADVVMMGRPNNPDGATLPRSACIALARAMEARGGWLVVDEAFGDMAPAEALAPLAGTSCRASWCCARWASSSAWPVRGSAFCAPRPI